MEWFGRVGDHPRVRALWVVATLGPIGYIPAAPGTAASLVAVWVWCALVPVTGGRVGWIVPLAAIGGVAAGQVARDRGAADPPEVVIDEAIGMFCALALAPPGIAAAAVTFVAFRAFDIVKPFPIRRLERLPGGWGIVADDLAAALYAAAAVRLVWALLG